MAGRLYKKDGRQYPSSTTITGQLDKSGPLTWWAAGCAADYVIDKINEAKAQTFKATTVIQFAELARKQFRSISSKARDIGTDVHKAIEYYLMTGNEPYIKEDEVLSGFVAFLEWAGKRHLQPLVEGCERTIYGENYAGTMDLICYLDGKLYVIDFKTSKAPKNGKPYEEWGYQVASYRHGAELEGFDVEGHGVLRLDKETGFPDWYDMSDQYESDFQVFQALALVWWLRNPQYADDWEGAHLIGYD